MNKVNWRPMLLNWTTGEFELALHYIDNIYFRHSDDAERVSEAEFDKKVEELRKETKAKKSG